MIPQKNISLICSKLYSKGQKRIPEQVIEKDYCISWFLFGLGESTIKENLIFKGGTCLLRCYFKNYRFSEDLDFTLNKDIEMQDIMQELNNIYEWVKQESGIEFSTAKIEPSTKNTHTFYINYIGPLPGKEKKLNTKTLRLQKHKVAFLQKKKDLKSYGKLDYMTK